jgi:putative glycosyl hydrolase-like family 15 (GHL15) protein
MDMAERLHRAGIVAVAMVATIVLSAVPAGADAASGTAHPAHAAGASRATASDHIPVWAADFMAGAVTVTRERAVRQARHFDMIVALKGTYARFVDAMRAANPDLTLLVYLNGVMAQANEGSKYPDSWYATDAHGNRVKSLGFGNFLMKPNHPGWVQDVADRCTSYLTESGYDGCFLDVLGTAPLNPWYVTSPPINQRTGTTWTEGAWLAATGDISQATRDAAGHAPVYGNGLSDGSRYFAQVPSSTLLKSLDGGMAESFVRDATAPVRDFRPHDAWAADVRMLVDAAQRDADTLSITKVWTTATARQRTAIQRYALGTFLLGYEPGHGYFSFRDDHGLTRFRPIWSVNLGDPIGAAHRVAGAFVRRFENGVVVVNPTAVRINVGLGSQADRRYRRAFGRARFDSNVSVRAHSASILTNG